MNTEKEKITSSKNVEEQEKLKMKYEEELSTIQQENLTLQNTITKKNDEIFELQKANKRIGEERDDWKKEARVARRVQAETKETKEQADFTSEYLKLQAQKGWQWDEASGWTKMTR